MKWTPAKPPKASCLASHAALASSSLVSTTAEEIGAALRQCEGEDTTTRAGGLTTMAVTNTSNEHIAMAPCV